MRWSAGGDAEGIYPPGDLSRRGASGARHYPRAERRVVELFDAEEIKNPDLQRYLNRLSSLCFVLELLENKAAGNKTTLAKE
jgi:cob(I)alamin adenosyltransferase